MQIDTNQHKYNGEQIISKYKVIHDCIHGYICLSNIEIMIIDSEYFQRLRKLKQLGTCSYVYHNAVHTRHEHSIGTLYLAGEIMEYIRKNTPCEDIEDYLSKIPELQSYYKKKYDNKIRIIDDHIIQLIKVAALCHDLGHGPFSHIFDDVYLPSVSTRKIGSPFLKHEYRSGILLEKIIKDNDFLSSIFSSDDIKFMKNLISPKIEHTGFIYQIIANNFNSLDVDKYDYLSRDLRSLDIKYGFTFDRLIKQVRVYNNNLCYPEQALNDIEKLFRTRYELHKSVYQHKSVISAQFMITEIFKYLDPVIGLSDSIYDMDKFCIMTDDYIMSCHLTLTSKYCNLPQDLLDSVNKAKLIIDRLNCHNLYANVGVITSADEITFSFDKLFTGLDNYDIPKIRNNIVIFKTTIGFVNKNKDNPFNNIYCYTTKDLYNSKFIAKKYDIKKHYHLSNNNNYYEHVLIVIYKDNNTNNTKIINLLRKNFSTLELTIV